MPPRVFVVVRHPWRSAEGRRAACVCALFLLALLLDQVWPLGAAPAHQAFIGLIIAIGSAISTFFHAFGSVTIAIILKAWELLRSGVVQLARALKSGLWETGRFLARSVQSLRGLWTHVLKPALSWANRKLFALETWLKVKFGPVLRFLARVKKAVDDFYKAYIRPIIDTIEFIRAVNRVLQVFHINLLRKLDEVLQKIEQTIEDPFLWVRAHITELENWIDRIVTLDGFFKRVTLLSSMSKYSAPWLNGFWNRQIDPAVKAGDEESRTRAFPIADAGRFGDELENSYRGRDNILQEQVDNLVELWNTEVKTVSAGASQA